MRLSIRIEATYQTGDAERTQPIALCVVLFQFGNVAAKENVIRASKKDCLRYTEAFSISGNKKMVR